MDTKFITGVSHHLYSPVDVLKITRHPEPQLDIFPGKTVKFTVSATGDGTLMYKWQRNDADLNHLPGVSDETTDTLQIENVKRSHKGTYRCIVSNAAGEARLSNPAQLTVRKCLIQLICGLPEIQQYSRHTDPFMFVRRVSCRIFFWHGM